MKYQVQENCLTVFLPEELDHHNTEEIREKTRSEHPSIFCAWYPLPAISITAVTLETRRNKNGKDCRFLQNSGCKEREESL